MMNCVRIAVLVGLSTIHLFAGRSAQAGGPNSDNNFRQPAKILLKPGADYDPAKRKFQGIPSLARTPDGRLWATWYAGITPREDQNNYVVLMMSADDGKTWSQVLVVDPDGPGPVRAFDPELWVDPDGKLWLFWAQAVGHDGSIAGVWTITCDNPDAAQPTWSPPRRLTDGIMMNKPTLLSTGEWVLPASTWRKTDNSAKMVVSTDRGKTWKVRGGCNVPAKMRSFDEHHIIERRDGTLWMLLRVRGKSIAESVSKDRGVTWTEAAPSAISHPSARFFVTRLASGNLLLVKHAGNKRDKIAAYVSKDDGKTWQGGLMLEPRGTTSYPDGIEAKDGRIYIIYDHNRTKEREILMAVFTEADALAGKEVSSKMRRAVVVHRPASK